MNNTIKKVFATGKTIPIVLSTDKIFAKYLYISLKSLIDNTNKENNYDIVIFYTEVSSYILNQIQSLNTNNISIRCVDMTEYLTKHPQLTYTHWAWTSAMYFRFFIPDFFKEYDKVLYTDCDTIFNFDVAELYNIDLENNWIGAIMDISQQMKNYVGEEYRENILKIKRAEYFNSGIILFNINILNNINFTEKCLSKLAELKTPVFPDQDVLNAVCNGHVKYLKHRYNLLWNCIHFFKDAKSRMDEKIYNEYIKEWQTPKIIHYAGAYKPWKRPDLEYSEYFWHYARKTPFYEELLFENLKKQPININKKEIENSIRNVTYRHRIYTQYLRCKILKHLTFGKTKEHYIEKTNKLKKSIQDYRKTLGK